MIDCFVQAYRQCDTSTEFQCDIQRCLNQTQKCDGYYNCDDRTDEQNCSKPIVEYWWSVCVTVNLRR